MNNLSIIEINSTNYYLLNCKEGYLLVDCGWVGKYSDFRKRLRRLGISVDSIKYILLTHHHHDHAALVQDIRKESNCKLIVHKDEIDYLKKGITYTRETRSYNIGLKLLDKILSPFVKYNYTPIVITDTDIIIHHDYFDICEILGIEGKVIHTPGHSKSSLSLILLNGDAFVGDVAMNTLKIFGQKVRPIEAENFDEVYKSWEKIIQCGAITIYPAHGKSFSVEELKKCLNEKQETI
ncbi:MAG: MBL fold metallo-hydrolase [bacterium]|nr:MBL fold metallo-hydrolase [bacterium]